MRIFFTLLAVFAIAAAPAFSAEREKKEPAKEESAAVKYEGGDGSSMAKAVVIKGAKDTEAGVAAEYAWVAKQHPGHQMRRQSLRGGGVKKYDVLSITTKDGKETDVWFDITEFFGKF